MSWVYWWSWDLPATTAIEEAIMKERRAFFAFGAMGASMETHFREDDL